MENAAQENNTQKTIKISEKQKNEIKVSRQMAVKLKAQWEELANRQHSMRNRIRSSRRITSITFTRDHHGKIAVQVNLRNGHSLTDNQQGMVLDSFKARSRQAYARAKVQELLNKIREYGFAAVEGEIPAELRDAVLKGMERANISTSYQGKKAEEEAAKRMSQNAANAANAAVGAAVFAAGAVTVSCQGFGSSPSDKAKQQNILDSIQQAGVFGKGSDPQIRRKRKDTNSIETTYTTENGYKTTFNTDRTNSVKVYLDEAEKLFKMREKGIRLNEDQMRRIKEWEKLGIKSPKDFIPGKDGRSAATKAVGKISNNVTEEYKLLHEKAALADEKRLKEDAKISLDAKLEQIAFINEQKKSGKPLSLEMEEIYRFATEHLLPRGTEATYEAVQEALEKAMKQTNDPSLPSNLEEIGRCNKYFLKDEGNELLSKEDLKTFFEKFNAGEVTVANTPLDVSLKTGKTVEEITENSRANRANGLETAEQKKMGQYMNALGEIFDKKALSPEMTKMAENMKNLNVNLGDLYAIVKNNKLNPEEKKELLSQLVENTQNNPERSASRKEQVPSKAAAPSATVAEETERVTGKLGKAYTNPKRTQAPQPAPKVKKVGLHNAITRCAPQPEAQPKTPRQPIDAAVIAAAKKRAQGR